MQKELFCERCLKMCISYMKYVSDYFPGVPRLHLDFIHGETSWTLKDNTLLTSGRETSPHTTLEKMGISKHHR